MSSLLKKTQDALMAYLDDPDDSRIRSIIETLQDSDADYRSFVLLYEKLLIDPSKELNIISQLDMLYEAECVKEELTISISSPPKTEESIPLGEDALDLLDDFVEETEEQLATIVDTLLELEESPSEAVSLLNKAFRAIHTVKGSAGFLALTDIIAISHEAETTLDKARAKGNISSDTISALLNIVQAIEEAVSLMQRTKTVPNLNVEALRKELIQSTHTIETVQEQKKPSPKQPAKMEIFRPNPIDLSPETLEILDDFVEEAHELLTNYCHLLKIGVTNPVEQEREETFRYIHTLRSNAQAIGLSTLPNLAGAAENLLEQHKGPILEEHREALLSVQDGIERILNNLSQNQRESQESHEDITLRLKKLQANTSKVSIPTTQPPKPTKNQQFLKVPIRSLNRMMNLSSELVVIKNRLQSLIHQAPPELEDLYNQLKTISREMQDEIGTARLQPIAIAFRKVPKIVREASKLTKKKVIVQFEGEELRLDKSLLDQLQEPLLHIVRNSIDHGIENAAVRQAAQKPKEGLLRIVAAVEGGMFCLRIHDDGGGVDFDKICRKAIEEGIYSIEDIDLLSPQQRQNLLFHPGLSSKDEANELSGRGMGMDIVKNRIELLRGSIQIQSTLGVGTTINIQVPLSVRILQTLLIPTCNTPVLIPQLRIQEVRSIEATDVTVIENKRYYTLGENLLPTISLSSILDQSLPPSKKIIICTRGTQLFGIETPNIVGFQEVVSHPLPKYLTSIHLYQGITILENGLPALIFNLDFIFSTFDLVGYNRTTQVHVQSNTIPYIVFAISSLMAIPLKQVRHVSKLDEEEITPCSGWEILRYAEEDFPLVEVYDIMSSKKDITTSYSYVLLFSNDTNIAVPISHVKGIFHTTQKPDTSLKRNGVLGTIQYENSPVEIIDINIFHQRIAQSYVSV